MTTSFDVVRGRSAGSQTVQTYGHIPNILEIPNLIKVQLDSFDWFKSYGLRELLDEISPIQDFTGSKMDLVFGEYEFRQPKHNQADCRERDMTFAAPLFVDVELRIKESGEIKEQRLFFGDFPLMTERGTFIVNGAERVVVSQLVRSLAGEFGVGDTIVVDRMPAEDGGVGLKIIARRAAIEPQPAAVS